MYSRDEAKKIKEHFWTAFGQYMRVVPFADGERLNWVNYKTGIKHLYFRLDANSKKAMVSIEMSHPDEGIRRLMYEQFAQMKFIFKQELGEDWEWEEDYVDDLGKPSSRIYTEIHQVSIFKKDDWPELISFFKPRLIALDSFWSTAKYAFDIFN